MTKLHIIGAGISGLAAAAHLGKAGFNVEVFEKNPREGGRASTFTSGGFTFDMGPSWYWMPDVFESFFNQFGTSASDHFTLKRLDPAYRVFFENDEVFDMPDSIEDVKEAFEKLESGSADRLEQFLTHAGEKYRIAMGNFVYRPSLHWSEYLNSEILRAGLKLDLFKGFRKYVKGYFKHPWIRAIMEFPVLFLGAEPRKTPAMYSLMNYAAIRMGTWYPEGGMYRIIEAMSKVARDQGANIHTNTEVEAILTQGNVAKGIRVNSEEIECDAIVASADYHHVESDLLPEKKRSYSPSYWESRVMAPSCLLFYIGTSVRIPGLLHHNLFFDTPFDPHAKLIYDQPAWPEKPQFYVCCPSKSDDSVAPEGSENLFILVPIAAGLASDPEAIDRTFDNISQRIEARTGVDIRTHLAYKKKYSVEDFERDYYAYKGNAYGLANTLLQTGFLKPRMKSKRIHNLYYTGQLTVPGPGMPPSLISGEIVARLVSRDMHKSRKFSQQTQMQDNASIV